MLNFLRRKRPAIEGISPTAFVNEQGAWMFFVARLHSLPAPGESSSTRYLHARIHELGFSRDWSVPLASEPPPKDPRLDGMCTDRMFFAQSGKTHGGSIAKIAIDEARVYDAQLRSEIDLTGFLVRLTMREDAYRPFVTYLLARPTHDRFLGPLFAMRIASQPFTFPAFRGNPDPSSGGEEYTKDLKPIRRLEPQELSVAIVERKQSPGDRTSASMHERYEVLSARKFCMTRR